MDDFWMVMMIVLVLALPVLLVLWLVELIWNLFKRKPVANMPTSVGDQSEFDRVVLLAIALDEGDFGEAWVEASVLSEDRSAKPKAMPTRTSAPYQGAILD